MHWKKYNEWLRLSDYQLKAKLKTRQCLLRKFLILCSQRLQVKDQATRLIAKHQDSQVSEFRQKSSTQSRLRKEWDPEMWDVVTSDIQRLESL